MRGVHLKELPFKCRKNPNCTRLFPRSTKALTHSQCKTKDNRLLSNNLKQVCYFCSQAFYELKSLRRHLCKEHTFENHFRCNLCLEPFNNSITLQRHILSIHVKKLYNYNKCNYCDYKSAWPGQHIIRNHTGLFPYQCYFCELPFQRFDHLRSHFKTHTKEQPLILCYFCREVKTRTECLYAHMRSHHLKEFVRAWIEDWLTNLFPIDNLL